MIPTEQLAAAWQKYQAASATQGDKVAASTLHYLLGCIDSLVFLDRPILKSEIVNAVERAVDYGIASWPQKNDN